MRFLVNLVLFMLVAAAFVWWLRPYWGRWKRVYQSLRNTLRFVHQVQQSAKNGGGFRVSTDFGRGAAADPKTVDATPKMTVKVGCPVCKEMLSHAQLEALRAGQLRCPAMQQGANCPYYGKALN
ncbi:MAG: hypothetical protein ACK41E_06740 [Deinococcales bacterium]